MKRFFYRRNLLVSLVLAACFSGCNAEQALQELADRAGVPTGRSDSSASQTEEVGRPAPPVRNDGDTISVASFNIQVFGISKLGKPQAMDVLAKTVRRFDVVAIQEVRAKDQTVLPRFVELINSEGAHYDHVIGPRLGRTSSKEQYAFVFDTSRIEVDRSSVYTVPDPSDYLHREPLVARFRVRGPAPDRAFTFSLVNIHTDPDETKTELNALDDAFLSVQHDGSGEDDVLLLGDLNVDEYHLGELGEIPGIGHAISGLKTNTLGTKSYDNIVFHRGATAEYVNSSGVLNLITEFNLTEDEALTVSDHMPVWAEFSIFEAIGAGPVASRPFDETR